jgi:type IV secretory pathway VirB4 component
VKGLAFDASDPGIKYVVLDEVAQLLRRPEMTALVHELYSTARKHNTSIWTVTQKYSDYVASAVAGTINLNSTTQLFLSHARAASVRRQIVEDFELNEREEFLFESLRTRKGEFSEALLRTEVWDELWGEKRSISPKIRIELSPFDYELCTSDAKDRELQKKFIEANAKIPLWRVVEEIARRKAAKNGGRR